MQTGSDIETLLIKRAIKESLNDVTNVSTLSPNDLRQVVVCHLI